MHENGWKSTLCYPRAKGQKGTIGKYRGKEREKGFSYKETGIRKPEQPP